MEILDKLDTPNPKNDKRTINAWAFFDWANSAYALVITVAIFPGYFLELTADQVNIGGLVIPDSTLYAWSISLAYLVIAIFSPLLSGIADYGGKRKSFLRFFTMLGALACISLFFFRSMDTLWIGVTGFVLATIGFAGGIVFYNSFLPIIASEDQYDRVSARGYSYGFIGSVILLVVNLIVIMNYDWFGFSEGLKAVPTAFIMVGLWWLGFAQIPFRRLPKDSDREEGINLLTKGFEEIIKVARIVRRDSQTVRYLFAFFCFNAGVNAVLFLASTFAEKELNFDTTKLIILVLILQIVAIGGAWMSTRLSEWKGNRFSLLLQLFVWTGICFAGFFVQTGLDFYLLAVMVGIVMGGVQALARSTYAKFLPENTQDTASFFSFFDVMDKTSTVAGTFVFGFVQQISEGVNILGSTTSGMRNSVLALAIFFVASIFILFTVRVRRMKEQTA